MIWSRSVVAHKPYPRILESIQTGGTNHFHHAINIGSVGKPKDGDPRGGYVILHINGDASTSSKENITVGLYALTMMSKAIEDSILPDAYAESLGLGK